MHQVWTEWGSAAPWVAPSHCSPLSVCVLPSLCTDFWIALIQDPRSRSKIRAQVPAWAGKEVFLLSLHTPPHPSSTLWPPTRDCLWGRPGVHPILLQTPTSVQRPHQLPPAEQGVRSQGTQTPCFSQKHADTASLSTASPFSLLSGADSGSPWGAVC